LVLALDVGSRYTKGLLFDGGIVETAVIKTSLKPRKAIEAARDRLTGYQRVVATGYGRELVESADLTVTEITAFARGALSVLPSVRTVIDIGGEDSKVIKIAGGQVERFVMNDRCAAGTGNFIERLASALDLTLDEFGSLASASSSPRMIDSLCVVMAETEVLSLIADGESTEDILAGVCDALTRRVVSLGEQVGIEPPVLLCGGGALNPGLVKATERLLGSVSVPDNPQFVGALGAAIRAAETLPLASP
jgi:predicted CoA-substrate-specific enzyme activase